MPESFVQPPIAQAYWLRHAHVPAGLLREPLPGTANREGLCAVDLKIVSGKIAAIVASSPVSDPELANVDLRGGMVWPCLIDMHTHLDKGHVWPRTPNPDGTFPTALKVIQQDAAAHWQPEELYRRMEFGLKCSYAHGTQAIRTHIDAAGKLAEMSLEVFQELQAQWADRLALQAVCLVPVAYFLTPAGEALADRMATIKGGVLGGLAFMNPELDAQLDRVYALAQERGLDLDFHVDESGNPDDRALFKVAEATLRHQFARQVVADHGCTLSLQDAITVQETVARLAEAKVGVISLPLCNLYLQDRSPQRTPRWRGVTALQELQQAGVDTVIASDNCRDPFHAFGDHDMLEVFALSTRIAHLDSDYATAPQTVTQTPARLMGLPEMGKLELGANADLILFRGRNFSELLSRSQFDRVVLRQGKAIVRTLPDYAELDDLFAAPAG